jgi:hypothetical protein
MIRRIATLWLQSWLFLIWSALCVCIGASWAFVAVVADLTARGVL